MKIDYEKILKDNISNIKHLKYSYPKLYESILNSMKEVEKQSKSRKIN